MSAVAGESRGFPRHGSPAPYTTTPTGYVHKRVDSSRAAEHLRKLTAAGVTHEQIAVKAGIARHTVGVILAGAPLVHQDTERLVLAVRPGAALASAGDGRVPSLGSSRRLQGLTAMGYESLYLAAECDVHRGTVRRLLHRQLMTVRRPTAERIASAARRLVLTPGGSRQARDRARRYGWVPLAAWDDIDNPDEQPDLGAWSKREPSIVEDTAELIAAGVPREEIARRLDLKWNSILMAHARCGVSLMGAFDE